ncbi:MAG: TlpA disulfide reductase family protein [Candidatus Hydrothermales bacterium]
MKDTILTKEILKNAEKLDENKYKIAIKINYYLSRDDRKGLFSYIKDKKLDPLIPNFRTFSRQKFLSPNFQPESLIIWIKEREKEKFEDLEGIISYVSMTESHLKEKDYKSLYSWIYKAKKLADDPCYIRKSFAFYALPFVNHKDFYKIFKNYIEEYIEKLKESVYFRLSSFYFDKNNIDSSYSYIKEIVENKDFTQVDPWILNHYARVMYKKGMLERSKLAYAYSVFYHGDSTQIDTLKKICGKSYEKEIKKLKEKVFKKVGKVSDFELTLLDGSVFKYRENRDKIIVLNFWSTGCAPCREEIPELNELVEKFKNNEKVIFIAVTREGKKTVENFLKKKDFKYTIAINDTYLHKELNIFGLPTHLIIDRNGRIIFKQMGYAKGTGEKIEEKLRTLLK